MEPIDDAVSFNLNRNNLNIDLKFSLINDSIHIDVKKDENVYQGEFSLISLQEKDKYFKLFDTIKEAYSCLLDYVRNGKYEVNLRENDLILFVSVQYNNKYIPISFLLKKLVKKRDECIKETFEISKNILKENTELKQKLTTLEQTYQNKFNELNNKIDKILKENKDLNDKLDKNTNSLNQILELLKNKGDNRNDRNEIINVIHISPKYRESFNGSEIIKNDVQIESLVGWINSNNNEMKFKLVYNAKKNGDRRQDFIRCCVGKNKLVILFKTDKGDILGAYINTTIVDDGTWVDDANAFLFNLNYSEKYKINREKNNYAYFLVNYYGPLFGYNNNQYNILIDDYILTSVNHSYFPTQIHFDFPINRVKDGKEFFKIKEFEVYQVI